MKPSSPVTPAHSLTADPSAAATSDTDSLLKYCQLICPEPGQHVHSRSLVFVADQDSPVDYWQPALVVPVEERSQAEMPVDPDLETVLLLNSLTFITCRADRLVAFVPGQQPYVTFRDRIPGFCQLRGIRLAVDYLKYGKFPLYARWKLWGLASVGADGKQTAALASPPPPKGFLSFMQQNPDFPLSQSPFEQLYQLWSGSRDTLLSVPKSAPSTATAAPIPATASSSLISSAFPTTSIPSLTLPGCSSLDVALDESASLGCRSLSQNMFVSAMTEMDGVMQEEDQLRQLGHQLKEENCTVEASMWVDGYHRKLALPLYQIMCWKWRAGNGSNKETPFSAYARFLSIQYGVPVEQLDGLLMDVYQRYLKDFETVFRTSLKKVYTSSMSRGPDRVRALINMHVKRPVVDAVLSEDTIPLPSLPGLGDDQNLESVKPMSRLGRLQTQKLIREKMARTNQNLMDVTIPQLKVSIEAHSLVLNAPLNLENYTQVLEQLSSLEREIACRDPRYVNQFGYGSDYSVDPGSHSTVYCSQANSALDMTPVASLLHLRRAFMQQVRHQRREQLRSKQLKQERWEKMRADCQSFLYRWRRTNEDRVYADLAEAETDLELKALFQKNMDLEWDDEMQSDIESESDMDEFTEEFAAMLERFHPLLEAPDVTVQKEVELELYLMSFTAASDPHSFSTSASGSDALEAAKVRVETCELQMNALRQRYRESMVSLCQLETEQKFWRQQRRLVMSSLETGTK